MIAINQLVKRIRFFGYFSARGINWTINQEVFTDRELKESLPQTKGRAYSLPVSLSRLYIPLLSLALSLPVVVWGAPCDRIPDLVAVTAQMRGLSVKHSIKCVALSRDSFRRLAHSVVVRDIDLRTSEPQAAILEFLGLIPSDYNYKKCIVDEFARRAAAFFDPFDDEMVLPDWTFISDGILVHEIVHALQAQHYRTEDFGTHGFIFDDQNLAAGALLEGDAMSIETLYESTHPSIDSSEVNQADQLKPLYNECELPEGVAHLAGSIYSYGEFFISTLRRSGREKDVDYAFKKVPEATNTILFPRLFSSRHPESEPAILAHLQKAVGKIRRAPIFEDRLGEMAIRMVLKETVSPEVSVQAATGWVGDIISVFHLEDSTKIVWSTLWSSGKDAQQFAAAWCKSWEIRLGISINPDVPLVIATVSGKRITIERSKRFVTVSETNYAKIARGAQR